MPKEGRTPISLDIFLKVNEDTDIRKLQPSELSELENAVLDNPYGKIHVRGGLDQKNSNSAGGSIHTLINVKDVAGTEMLLAGLTTTIKRATTGTWTTIKSSLTGTGRFEWTPIKGGLAITNGYDKPFVLFDTNFGSTENLELERPDVTAQQGQLADNGTIGTPFGDLEYDQMYTWCWVYVTETGERSEPSQPFTFLRTGSASFMKDQYNERVLFRNVPVPTDSRITSKWLYRTEGSDWGIAGEVDEDGKFFYLAGKFDPSVTDLVDSVADTELDFSDILIYTRTPLKANYITRSNGRLFLGGVTIQQYNYVGHIQRVRTVPAGTTTNWQGTGVNYINSVTDGHPVTYGAGGNLDASSYYMWAVTFVDKFGLESKPMYTNCAQSGATNKTATLTMLFDARLGSYERIDTNAVARRYYRTEGQAGTFTWDQYPFYYQGEETYDPLDTLNRNLPTTYTDAVADGSLDTTKYWSGGVLTRNADPVQPAVFKSAITFSQVDQEAYSKLENIRQIFEEDGDTITGIFDDGNGVLIFKENSIVKLYHTGSPDNWYIRKIWEEHGCDTPKSLVKQGSTYYFVNRNRPYRMVSGQPPQYIGLGKQTTWDTVSTVISVTANDEWAIFAVQIGSNYSALIFDNKLETWYQFNWATNAITAVGMKKYNTFWTKNLFLASYNNTVYQYAPDDPTDDILVDEVQPVITFPAFKVSDDTECKLREVYINTDIVGTVTIQPYSDSAGLSPKTFTGDKIIRAQFSDVGISSYWTINLTGDFTQLHAIKVDLRPVERRING